MKFKSHMCQSFWRILQLLNEYLYFKKLKGKDYFIYFKQI